MIRALLLIAAFAVVGILFVLPLGTVFAEAFSRGVPFVWTALSDPDALAAIRLTLFVAVIAVPVNTICGLAAAWCITKFSFPGKRLLLFGANGWFGHALEARDIHIVFAVPGIVLATVFVTFPFVARTVMPLMQAQGRTQEEAAALLGAGFFATFFRVTLPDIVWAVLAGVLLCTARAMGEFGAVSVVSGHIPGVTETMPLHIESLYDDYQSAAAFAMAACLGMFALITLAAKAALECRLGSRLGAV
jgi:sulfate transport system permease protein